jgi:tRNA A-37 threonylcarbamoyl transferase component Bud32
VTEKFPRLQEVRSILRARKLGVNAPAIYFVEHAASAIYLEKVAGMSVKDVLRQGSLDGPGAGRDVPS